ncbi:hypothetical protein OIU77_020420 [Salix suchowensis]|uniref:Uncharacterized protein n=1 Tax=Salix suchowensis TaxID=1278906 RepID=A0ABQ9C9G4_9ROSI|nr:hypothetical protein IMY05_004G0174800 [Salix suchowensis]KAJ6369342.1 hypothetical protein OIU78_001664 [Salix suchowensis]KAJ6395153.1 hypothetical protein OIU77_020420 [Salix suchowensis]KAJ6395154.1 hypothetical protein OIU77_020420 [Salix suchowensis]
MNSESCTDQTIKTHEEQAKKAIVKASLGPVTPDSIKETGDFPLSPATLVKKLPKALSFTTITNRSEDHLDNFSSPRTPKDGVFDPFAPGHEDKILAPQCKKYYDEARASVVRRLNFTSSFRALRNESFGDDVEFLSDEEMFESVYESLLEAIVLKQTEGALEEMTKLEWDSDCTTPPAAPILTGVPDTCPAAPLKRKGKSRTIDLGLCRKLEF